MVPFARRLWRDDRQQTGDCRSSRRDLQVGVLPASPSVDDHQVAVNRRCDEICRLDYRNELLCGIIADLFQRLQSVQNAAARLVSGTRRRDHITPVVQQLH